MLGSKLFYIQEKSAQVKEYSDKSGGPDEIHFGVLQELAEMISELLEIFFESSWRMGEVPEGGRKANTVPIFKKGK